MKSIGLFLVLSVAGDNLNCPDEAVREVKWDGKLKFPFFLLLNNFRRLPVPFLSPGQVLQE